MARSRASREGAKTPALVWVLFGLVMGAGAGGACVTCAKVASVGQDEVVGSGKDRVGVVELVGPITESETVVRHIREFARRDDIQAVVVRIDSPGGAVAPSQEIYSAMRFCSKAKPVVASMAKVAASGGFWAALGADRVFASAGSITGSIGVLSQTPDLRGLAELLKIRLRTFKSGPLKDAGNPFRELNKEDEALFMSLIRDIYEQFVSVTAKRRGLPEKRVRILADGRVMTGRAALEAGLVDELGGLYEAARRAAQMASARSSGQTESSTRSVAGPEGKDPTLVYPKEPGPDFLKMLAEATSQVLSSGIEGAFLSLTSDSSGHLVR